MYISQSAITQSIQKLENILGGKVFYRNKTGVELTEEGKNLYEYIKDSIETMNNAENVFSKYNNLEKGKIRIGGGNALVYSLIFEPLLAFIKQYPTINIYINSGLTDSLMRKLSNGELDIVILNLPYTNKKYSNIQIIPLKKSSFSFFASKQYLKEHPVNDLKEIVNRTLILPKKYSIKNDILSEYSKKTQMELKANYEVSSSSIMKRMVLSNIGIGFTNTELLDNISDKIKIINTIEIDTAKEGIAVLKKNMSNKATIELVEQIKQYYKLD